MKTHRPLPRLAFGQGRAFEGSRELPEEVAVAISYNGSTQAVMMATPADLTDFAYGFSLTEGIATPEEVETVEVVETRLGLDLQIWLRAEAEARQTARRRSMAGPVGCGLCGIDSLEQALRHPRAIPEQAFAMTPRQIMQATAALTQHQPLHDTTRAAHAAAFWQDGRIIAAREDVGRHNALDKLIGALAREGADLSAGFVLMSSRCSFELVQKCAIAGVGALATVSAPTALALSLARQAHLKLAALASRGVMIFDED